MTADELRLIALTAVTVGGAIATFGRWALKAVISEEVKPTLVQLGSEAQALTREFQTFREGKEEERRETRAILTDLDKIVRDHETRLTVLERAK